MIERMRVVPWIIAIASLATTGCFTTAGSNDQPGIDPGEVGDALDDGSGGDVLFPPDDGGSDTGDANRTDTGGPLDTGVGDTGAADVPVDVADDGPGCDESKCGAVPTGAKHVGLVDRAIPCPAGYVQTDVVEATAGDGCTCSCAVGAKPTCPGNGSIATAYGGTAACGSTGLTLTSPATDTCGDLGVTGSTAKFFKGTAPPPIGGTCTPTTKVDKAGVQRNRRLCEPKAGTCQAPICNTPFLECVEVAGACPAAFPNARTVGTDFALTCPACACGLSASCSGTLTLYKDADCKGPTTTLTVDGTCIATTDGVTVSSFKYKPSPATTACTPSYTGVPGSRTFVLPRQLCCK